jgi:hypothetical protein
MMFVIGRNGKLLSHEVCQLLCYWQSLGGGERVPERSSLNLRHLTAVLPWMFILEMSQDGSLRYRLAGSSLEEAIGRGMAGQYYSDVYAEDEQASMMEELYAVSLVQGSGVLRTGSFRLHSEHVSDMEVLALPFQDSRSMGGSIMVGVVAPFDFQNQGFIDRWGEFKQEIDTILTVASPRFVTYHQLSKRGQLLLKRNDIEIRAMDTAKVIQIEENGLHHKHTEVPSLDIDQIDIESLN